MGSRLGVLTAATLMLATFVVVATTLVAVAEAPQAGPDLINLSSASAPQ